ncbi:MAG: hypothetical protein H6835_03255 [Planctomycetes bacterium]|nr:hypothetical protein [Planctomycetota bacterium]
MAELIASILFVPAAAVLCGVGFSKQRWGPEGPVGAHMVTAPLALAVVVALLVAGLGGSFADAAVAAGTPRWPLFASLPALFLALVVLPIMAGDRKSRIWARLGIGVTVAGGVLVLWAPLAAPDTAAAAVGMWLVAAVGGAAYAVLAVAWMQLQAQRQRSIQKALERDREYADEQAKWQRDEWAKLPAEPALWQLIQFEHSRDPGVQQACLDKIAALPDLDGEMQKLLGTGWGEHALDYIRRHYPHSRASLAPALSALLDKQREKWRTTLERPGNHGSWFGNLATIVEAARNVAADGGDVRAAMRGWAKLLRGKRGLEQLAEEAAQLAGD